jgi:hypothetical protein
MRTAENWMLFAESILSRAQVDACNAPLLLGTVEINGTAHDSILKLVPEIMDGKGMMRFMRDSRLLRVIRRARNQPNTPHCARDILRQKNARARCVWDRILVNLDKAAKKLPDIESAGDLNRYATFLTEASHKLRAAIKARKVEAVRDARK